MRRKHKADWRKKNPNKANDFGGMAIDFTGQATTLEQVFGVHNIPPREMLRVLWEFAKTNNLISKSRPYAPVRVKKSEREIQNV